MSRFLFAAVLATASCRGQDQDEAPQDDFQLDPLGLPSEGELDPAEPALIPPADDPIVAPSLDLAAKGPPAVPMAGEGTEPIPVDGASNDGVMPASRTVDVVVERGESMKLYSDWSGIGENDLLPDGGLVKPRLKAGQRLQLVMTHDQFQRFSDNREKYRLAREREFLERHEIEKLIEHKVETGDNLWKIAQVGGPDVPVWLLKRLNRNLDLEHLRIGDVVLVPKLREVAERGERAGDVLWRPSDQIPVEKLTDTDGGGSVKKVVGADPAEASQGLNIRVKAGETVQLLSTWSGLSVETIRKDNRTIGRGLAYDQPLVLRMPEKRVVEFTKRRQQFHDAREERERLFDVGDEPGGAANRPAGGPAQTHGGEKRPVLRPNVRLRAVKVQKGDTLQKIATRHNVTVAAIKANNPKLKGLRPGDIVQVPVEKRR